MTTAALCGDVLEALKRTEYDACFEFARRQQPANLPILEAGAARLGRVTLHLMTLQPDALIAWKFPESFAPVPGDILPAALNAAAEEDEAGVRTQLAELAFKDLVTTSSAAGHLERAARHLIDTHPAAIGHRSPKGGFSSDPGPTFPFALISKVVLAIALHHEKQTPITNIGVMMGLYKPTLYTVTSRIAAHLNQKRSFVMTLSVESAREPLQAVSILNIQCQSLSRAGSCPAVSTFGSVYLVYLHGRNAISPPRIFAGSRF